MEEKMSRLQDDSRRVEEIIGKYTGTGRANMCFLSEKGRREFTMGGDAQVLVTGILELLTQISVYVVSDEQREDFLVSVIEAVREMSKEMKVQRAD